MNETKITSLRAYIASIPGVVVVAFSGGVDSTTLLKVASDVKHADVIAVTGDSASLPSADRRFITEFCKTYGISHKFIATNEAHHDGYVRNDGNRCYWCKKELYTCLEEFARSMSAACVFDGSNLSDKDDWRPGSRAVDENAFVKRPFAELFMTKDDVRAVARELQLPVTDKPASACLSSRVMPGISISDDVLRRVDAIESHIRELGFDVVRVRHHGELARIEIVKEDIARFADVSSDVERFATGLGYKYITLDLGGYKRGGGANP